MFNSLKYSHLATKIRGMLGRMLTEEDFTKLQNMKSVEDIGNYIRKNTYYGDSFDIEADEKIHRGELEEILQKGFIRDILKISRYLKGNEKDIYRYIYRKYEIEDIKKMLRMLLTYPSLEKINRETLFISHHSKINFEKTLKSNNAKELVKSLKGTNFYDILKPLLSDTGNIDLFAAEMTLDLYYYHRLVLSEGHKTSAANRKVLKESFGLDADFKNIMWIYRGKNYFNIKKEILYRYMFPGGRHLSKKILINLVETTSMEELKNKLKEGYYGKIIDFDSYHWHNSFYQYYGHKQKMNIRLLSGTIAPVIGYISMKEIEIMNIITIIEGVRYQVESSRIASHLVNIGKRKEG